MSEQEFKKELTHVKTKFYVLLFFSIWGGFAFLQLAINSECF